MLDFYNFIENNPIFRQFSVDELLFTAYDCPIEESPLDYWVDKNYFCYIIRGGAKWKTPKQEYVFEVGDAAFLNKGAHRVFKILNAEFCALLIFVPDEFIGSVIKNNIPINQGTINVKPTDTVIPLILDQSLSDYFNSILNYFSLPSPPSKSLLNIRFKELILNIITGNHNPKLSEYFMGISYSRKRPLEAIMEENFIFNISLKDFAKLSGRSLATFKRDFEKKYNTSPGKWLKNKRLEYSKFLLETTPLNINEITLEIGFENTSHFIRIFKEKYDHSPLQYQKSLQR